MTQTILTVGLLTQPRHCGVGDDISMLAELEATTHQAIMGIAPKGATPYFLPPEVIKAQIAGYNKINTIKLGYLGGVEQIEALYGPLRELANQNSAPIVLSPDFAPVGGQSRYDGAAMNAFKRDILLITDLVILNTTEATLLTGMQVRDAEEMAFVAEMMLTLGPKAVLLRGGDFREDFETNIFVTDTTQLTFTTPRLQRDTLTGHQEAGNAMACAIAHSLSHNQPYEQAISAALHFTKGLYLSGL